MMTFLLSWIQVCLKYGSKMQTEWVIDFRSPEISWGLGFGCGSHEHRHHINPASLWTFSISINKALITACYPLYTPSSFTLSLLICVFHISWGRRAFLSPLLTCSLGTKGSCIETKWGETSHHTLQAFCGSCQIAFIQQYIYILIVKSHFLHFGI